MDIDISEVRNHVERLKEEAGGAHKLAESIGVSHQTIYNLLAGGWPSKDVAEKLNLRLVALSEVSK